MNKSISCVVNSMLKEHSNGVWQLLKTTPGQRPPVNNFRKILFDVLLISEDVNTSLDAVLCINQFLEEYPPENIESQKYYTDVLFDQEGVTYWWDKVSELIRCCFQKCGILDHPCKKNCLFLLKYIIAIIKKDHECFTHEEENSDANFSDMPLKPRSIIANLFWPNRETSQSSKNMHMLITYIDGVFSSGISGEKVELLQHLVTLFSLASDSIITYSNIDPCQVFTSVPCDSIVNSLEAICTSSNIWSSSENLKLFLAFTSLSWLKVLISWSVLNQMIYHTSNYVEFPISLQKVIDFFIFPTKEHDHNSRKLRKLALQLDFTNDKTYAVSESNEKVVENELCIEKKHKGKRSFRKAKFGPEKATKSFSDFGSVNECRTFLLCFQNLLSHYTMVFKLKELAAMKAEMPWALKYHLLKYFNCRTTSTCASHLNCDIQTLNHLLVFVNQLVCNIKTTSTELQRDSELLCLSVLVAFLQYEFNILT